MAPSSVSMKTKLAVALGAAVALIVFGFVMKSTGNQESRGAMSTTHVVLIGASIGQAWHLAEWPSRVGVSGLIAESIPAWQFDKTEVLDEVLMRPRRNFHPTRTYLKSLFQPPPDRPGIVILKECSSYFPGNLALYKSRVRQWVSQIREKQITVVLATVVPVTEARARQNAGKQESLVEYNRWIREYAQEQGIILLDLETALRSPRDGRFLREEYATADGTHLNAAAYAVLDNLLRDTLRPTKPLSALSGVH